MVTTKSDVAAPTDSTRKRSKGISFLTSPLVQNRPVIATSAITGHGRRIDERSSPAIGSHSSCARGACALSRATLGLDRSHEREDPTTTNVLDSSLTTFPLLHVGQSEVDRNNTRRTVSNKPDSKDATMFPVRIAWQVSRIAVRLLCYLRNSSFNESNARDDVCNRCLAYHLSSAGMMYHGVDFVLVAGKASSIAI